ncbi:hypothetical protein ATCC90586_004813 [Pythium insidiosum]|nr:hypothetical protein ATCC90586_004813 [Pythium insidiosum]
MKRGRVDGGISKEDYEASESAAASGAVALNGGFDRASNEVLRTRKLAVAASPAGPLSDALRRHRAALNAAFVRNLEAQRTHRNLDGDWSVNMREYLWYAREISQTWDAGRRGKALTFGSGDCGQLGHGVEEDDDLMVKFPRPVALLEKLSIARVSCGGLHSAAVTRDGAVYTWGCNDDGALGRSGEENLPAPVEGFGRDAPHKALVVVGGDSHTAVVTTEGRVFTWGGYKDKEGKLWCDSAAPKSSFKQKQSKPFLVEALRNIVELRCGSSFNVARASNGHVYSWGLGEMGQLARDVPGDLKKKDSDEYDVDMVFRRHLQPARVTLGSAELPAVRAIGCGAYHTLLVLGATGDLYTTGLNNYGQLGVGHTDNCTELQLVDDLVGQNVVRVEGGTHHSVVLTADGSVYAFGRADSGQLGMLDDCQTGDFKDRPQRVTFPDKSARIAMISSGSNHTLALSEDNKVFSWGYGDMLALGHGDEQDETRPRRLDWSKAAFAADATILQVDAGGQHSAIIATTD